MDRVRNERDRMLQENSEIGRDKQDADTEKMKLKSELKDLKFRETRMLADYSELEEENITLQKQVSNLRCSQVSSCFGDSNQVIIRFDFPPTCRSNSKLQNMKFEDCLRKSNC